MYLVTPKQMKIIEKNANDGGVSYKTLMQNAGTQLAQFITELPLDLSKGIIFFCGNGNNGGDGFVAAKMLSQAGFPVTVVLMCGDPATEIAGEAFLDLSGESAEVLFLNDNIEKIFSEISSASLIIDAVFGMGFHGELPPQIKACFSYTARAACKKLAVDVPSGGNCLTGEIAENTLKCDYTVTFGYKKLGQEFSPLKEYCGELLVADIGIPKNAFSNIERPISKLEFSNMEIIIPPRAPDSHKGNFGRLVNISGSKKMPGACAMSTLAALRCGVGLCTIASAESVCSALSANIYETMYLPLEENENGEIAFSNAEKILAGCEKASAVIIGCGLGVSNDTEKLVEFLIQNLKSPIILDADGINCIASRIDIIKNAKAGVVLTPHPGELARLLGITVEEVLKDRFGYAIKLSNELGATVVSKGVPTFIAADNGFCFLSDTGNPGLSRGGSGDILTGMIASFIAQGIPPAEAAAAGVFLHGMAADMTAENLSMQGMLPTDVIAHLPLLFKKMNR